MAVTILASLLKAIKQQVTEYQSTKGEPKMRKPRMQEFIEAVRNNDIPEIERCTSTSDIDLNGWNDFYITPLIAATISNNLHLIPLLIEKGASVHAYDRWGNTILHYLCHTPYMDNLEAIKVLLSCGADINCRIPDNAEAYEATPAYCAIRHENYPLLKFLLENGADAKARTHSLDPDKSLLSEAYFRFVGDEEKFAAIKLLLEHGVSIKDSNYFIGSVARNSNSGCVPLMELLLEYNVTKHLNLPGNIDDCTLLHYTVLDDVTDDIIKLLLKNGAKHGITENAEEDEYYNHLHKLDAQDQQTLEIDFTYEWRLERKVNMIKLLLKKGADINARDRLGKTPLQYAVNALKEQEAQKAQNVRK